MSVGAGGGLNLALKALLNRGEEVIVFAPYFPEYLLYIASHSGVARLFRLTAASSRIWRLWKKPSHPTPRSYHQLTQ